MVNYILTLLVLGLLPIWSLIKVLFSNTLVPEVVFIINVDLPNKSNYNPLNITCKLKNNIKFLKTSITKKKKKNKFL